MRQAAGRGRYHHGDLRAALVDTAVELIGERGVHGFSLAEASRRIGVTVSAPYRHFADRDELIAAVAVRAYDLLADALRNAISTQSDPARQLATVAGAYVRFAAVHRPLFEALFSAGLDKSRHPDLEQASQRVYAVVAAPAHTLAGSDAALLVGAIAAAAHGHASLLVDGKATTDPMTVDAVVEAAARTALALVEGRAALVTPTGMTGDAARPAPR